MATYSKNYLAHHGVKGMKWGVRRAEKLAIKSARSAATARQFKKDTDEVVGQFRARAQLSREMVGYHMRRGDAKASNSSKLNAAYQEKRANEIYRNGMTVAEAWIKKSERQNIKARALMKKYGVSDGEQKVNKILESYRNVPYESLIKGFKDTLYRSP